VGGGATARRAELWAGNGEGGERRRKSSGKRAESYSREKGTTQKGRKRRGGSRGKLAGRERRAFIETKRSNEWEKGNQGGNS